MSQSKKLVVDKEITTNSVSDMTTISPVDELMEVESCLQKQMNTCSIAVDYEDFVLQPNEYEIVALVDTSLVRDMSFEDIQKEFKHSKIKLQSLKIGDCVWVARGVTTNTTGKILVLPYLALKDDKLVQEKTRLECRECGFSRILHIKEESLNPTADSVRVAHNIHRIGEFYYFEKITKNQQDTFRYLADLTLRLNESFQGKAVRSCQRSCLPNRFSMIPITIPLITWKEFSSFFL